MFHLSDSTWLTPYEQEEAITRMIEFGLFKWDNRRSLPLKSGGKTDLYFNGRACRNHPLATSFLANHFANPMRRLGIDRFVEMPSAMSGVAGVMQGLLGKPYVTIRDTPKAGRVSDAELIGELVPGQRTALFDDVITEAGTKIPAYHLCCKRGVKPTALVVMVDRQQGWKETFAQHGIDMPVWAGMTLHDIRAHLIRNGLMERCSPEAEAKNPLILALDGRPWGGILPLIDRLRPTGCILKANDLIWDGKAVDMIRRLMVYGRVMFDCKSHDVPSTVANYLKRLRPTPPWAVTVHASGGTEMVRAAAAALENTPTIILAITLLTSIGDEGMEIYRRQPMRQVEKMAALAWNAGARGFVCSVDEAARLRSLYPQATIVVPGLTSDGKPSPGQKRAGTFVNAKKAGASYMVTGRQVLNSPDSEAEVRRILTQELHIEL